MNFGKLYFILHLFFNIWRIFLKTVGEVVSTLFRRLDWDQYGSICNGLEQVGGNDCSTSYWRLNSFKTKRFCFDTSQISPELDRTRWTRYLTAPWWEWWWWWWPNVTYAQGALFFLAFGRTERLSWLTLLLDGHISTVGPNLLRHLTILESHHD